MFRFLRKKATLVGRKPVHKVQLRLEPLEERCAPASFSWWGITGGTQIQPSGTQITGGTQLTSYVVQSS